MFVCLCHQVLKVTGVGTLTGDFVLQYQFYEKFLTFHPVTLVPFETKLIKFEMLDANAVRTAIQSNIKLIFVGKFVGTVHVCASPAEMAESVQQTLS